MIQKPRLFTPGPTPLHPAVQEAMARPIPHHRTDEFRKVFAESITGLKAFLKTTDDVLILACSGTGGMEAALVNVLSPGDTMLALVAGSFGERWSALGRAYGMNVKELRAKWGEAVAPEEVGRALEADPAIRAVFVQLSESSTGAAHDVQALARLTRECKDTLLVVDAISGAGALPLETEAWGVDVAVVGSQKALALGLPLVAPRDHGDALTALYPPAGIESGAIVKGLKSEFGSTVAGGQGELKGKILRIAHLGYYDATDILGLIATLEIVLRRVGHRFEVGRGVAAAEEEY